MIVRSNAGRTFAVRKQQESPETERVVSEFRRRLNELLADIRADVRDILRTREVAPPEGWQATIKEIALNHHNDLLEVFRYGARHGLGAGRRTAARRFQLDIDFDQQPQSAIDELDAYVDDVADEVIDELGGQLEPRIQSWLEVGLDYDEIADRLVAGAHDVVGDVAAERHARTITHGAAQRGHHASITESSAVGEEWVAVGDTRTRETHNDADGQVVRPDMTFIVGGSELRFPGDPLGAVGEVVHCRCQVVPVWRDDFSNSALARLEQGERLNV